MAIVQEGSAIIGVEIRSTKADSKTGLPVQTDVQDRIIGTRIACNIHPWYRNETPRYEHVAAACLGNRERQNGRAGNEGGEWLVSA